MQSRRRWLLLFLLIGAVSIGGWWWRRVNSTPPVVAPSSLLLERRVSLAVREKPLYDVVAQLARSNGLKLSIDQAALQQLGYTGYEPVSFEIPNIRMRDALELLPELVDSHLRLELHGDSILVTTLGANPRPAPAIETRLYPLTELMGNPLEFNPPALAEVIQSHIHPDSWERVEGPAVLEEFPTALLISTTDDAHCQIEFFVRQLGKPDPAGLQPIPLGPCDSLDQVLEAQLNAPITFDFWQTPLTEIVRWLRDEHHVPILLDHRALQDLGVDEQQPMTLTLRDVSLRSALRRTLHPLDLVFESRHGVLVVTVPDEQPITTRLYPIHDLVAWLDGNVAALLDVTDDVVCEVSFDPFADDNYDYLGGYLIATQPQSVHDELDQWFAKLRRKAFPYLYRWSRQPPSPAIERIEQTLARVATFGSVQEPLSEVATRLTREFDINVLVDDRALQDAGFPDRSLISIPPSEQPLGHVLSTGLKPYGLALSIRDEALLMTWIERVTYPDLQVHDVADLVQSPSDVGPTELTDALSSLAQNDDSETPCIVQLGTVLVVHDVPLMQWKIAWILQALRQWQAAGEPNHFHLPGIGETASLYLFSVADIVAALKTQRAVEAPTAWFLEAVDTQPRRSHEFLSVDREASLELRLVEAIQLVSNWSQPLPCCLYRDCLLVVGRAPDAEQVDQVVKQLRQLLCTGASPDRITTLTANGGLLEDALSRNHVFFDVRPVCRKYPRLDTDALAALVLETIQPTASEWNFPVTTALPGAIFVRRYYDSEYQIRQLLHYLAFEIEQPAVLELLEYPETVAPSTIDFLCRELFRPEGYRRALATRLLRDVPDPPPKVVRLLADRKSTRLNSSHRQ